MRQCSASDCEDKVAARGLCNKHYHRMRAHGTTRSLAERNAKSCEAVECESMAISRGLCNKHYLRMRVHGSLELPVTRNTKLDTPEKVLARLEQESVRVGDCWLWTGGMVAGYGRFKANGKNILAHRASYEVHVGPIPDGVQVHHTCFNTNCIEPRHLEAVTRRENNQALKGPQGKTASGIRGVSWKPSTKKWVARATTGGRDYHAGYFDNIEDAERAAKALRKELGFYGE